MYYKFLTDDMTGGYSAYRYTPGEWTPAVGPLSMCETGYHVVGREQILPWIMAQLWEVETKGDGLHCDDKSCFESIRLVRRLDGWNADTQRAFALDCAIKVLPIFENHAPDDKRVRECIRVTREYLAGKATRKELDAAADAAAYAAAYAAADAAADAAAYAAADAAYAAADAAYAAADAADAARAARAARAADAAADAARAEFSAWAISQFWNYVEGTATPLPLED